MALLWRHELPIAVLNGGFMGPSDDAVIHMIREALRGPDDVDQLGKCGAPTADGSGVDTPPVSSMAMENLPKNGGLDGKNSYKWGSFNLHI